MGLARKAFSIAMSGNGPLPRREPTDRSIRQEVLRTTKKAGEADIG